VSFLNTVIEFEGPVVNVRPRYWAAHKAAVTAVGYEGPPESEFWRLLRTASPDGMMVQYGKSHQVAEYARLRGQKIDSTELMAMDEAQDKADENLRVLKALGTCHLVTLCENREGMNATLDRLNIWMHFDQKRVLPQDRERRVQALRELKAGHRSNMAVVGSVPMAYAAGEAGFCTVGLRTGLAVPKLLQQVGVDVFYDNLDELTDAISRRDPDLIRIGLL
jgi:phosphoglycolate phosphatase-like HAD superfamily hydrolase